ncbi:oxidoreductase [Jatrophihabitans telluris]|uniref:Oxidoreductase n=1 Tax=Jatrophihabitans telluris TaxID=2038343 RepID=A0ABY4R0R5_9ACTN|nr:oxidoreductase [Jatrophihabitans telluris]UQX88851.1 oxidoreductase [Jatrophihabitans telluris]
MPQPPSSSPPDQPVTDRSRKHRTEVVLVTGCSSGIGAATAARLAAAGHIVYASARQPDTLAALTVGGCRPLALDVTSEESMTGAVDRVLAEQGRIDVLVNNAGYGQYGPIEQIPIEQVRQQFETNVFGLVRLTQLVLPGMRQRRHGRIVNVSSMGGRTTLPGGGIYHASKYAVEAVSNALRLEVRPFGVQVVLIEPGVVRTPWSEQALGHQQSTGTENDPYARYKQGVEVSFASAFTGSLAKLSISPDQVAEVIERAVAARRPRARYLISAMAKSLVLLDAVLPDRIHDAVLRQQYHLP